MKRKHKLLLLDILGAYFLLLGIIAISRSMLRQEPTQILYMCYIGMIVIGIGILTKRSFLIMSQIYILAIPLIIWDIDFLYWLIFHKPLWGITDYFFIEAAFNIDKFVSLQHLYTVPVAIYATKIIGLKRKDAWKWSLVQITLLYVLISLLANPVGNINCVFDPCVNISLGLPYRVTWFLIIFSMTFIASMIINHILTRNEKNNTQKT